MAAPDPRIASIPPGWVTPRASRKGLVLLPAEMFNRTYTPAKDAALHVAPLRRPPVPLVVACGVIAVFFALIVWSVLAQAGRTASMQGPVPYVIAVIFGLLGLFFLFTFINMIAAIRSRGSWGNRQCVALGRSGIALRFQGAVEDLEWSDVSSIRAMITNTDSIRGWRRAHVAVLRIERGKEHWQVATSVLDANPVVLYTVLHYYWTHPGQRAELGTTFAQQRMDLQAGYTPQTIAPGVTRFTGADGSGSAEAARAAWMARVAAEARGEQIEAPTPVDAIPSAAPAPEADVGEEEEREDESERT